MLLLGHVDYDASRGDPACVSPRAHLPRGKGTLRLKAVFRHQLKMEAAKERGGCHQLKLVAAIERSTAMCVRASFIDERGERALRELKVKRREKAGAGIGNVNRHRAGRG